MKIVADTNVLLRAVLEGEAAQRVLAVETMRSAESVAVGVHALSEFAWVPSRRHAVPRDDIAAAIRRLGDTERVVVDRPTVDAGLAMLDAGGDFADGAIAFEGRWLGGETFVSFDRKAVRLMEAHGGATALLTAPAGPVP